ANPDALVNLGNELAREGKNLTAVNYYKQALAIKPNHDVAKISLAVSLLTIDKDQSKELLLTLKESDSVGPRAHMLLGKLAHDDRRYEEAIQHYKVAIEGNPKLIDARMNYAMALVRSNQSTEALKQMRLVVAERPKDALAWMNIGIVFTAVGDRQKAKQCYEYSITLNKYIAETHFNYARCAESFGNTLIAVEEYELALKLNKFYWQASFNIGLIYLKDKRPDKALNFFNQTISIRASFAPSHLNRAKALLQLKKVDEAKSALRTYLLLSPKDDPDRDSIEKALKTMESSQEASGRRGF
ncbi:MAG: tetratricopeptide repeat protein, partial [Planctomycetota bacterium]|nr:tetratricopeptide repeat protein [Planctomycetota bacterium]